MLFQVRLPFGFVPNEFHELSMYINIYTVKEFFQERFDIPAHPVIIRPLPQKTAVGIRIPNGAAKSRSVQDVRLFCACVSSNGRPGGRSRKARRCSIGNANFRFGRPPQFALGLAVQKPQLEHTMTHTPTPGASAPVIPPEEIINPHCCRPWPHGCLKDDALIHLTEASYAAYILFDLLEADKSIASDLKDLESDENTPRPFTDFVHGGLLKALKISLHEIQKITEKLQNRKENQL
jgi:hypothetical protein